MIGITLGDPGGVGPEVVIKALEKIEGDFVIIGSKKVLSFYEKLFGYRKWRRYEVVDPWPEVNFSPGQPEGEASFHYFREGVRLVEEGKLKALATAPVSKIAWYHAGFRFAGHTEYLEKRYGTKVYMGFYSEGMKVLLFTHHIPLRKALDQLNRRELRTFLSAAKKFLQDYFGEKELLIASINPHAGEGGTLGKEEEDVIKPVIEEFRRSNFTFTGPLPTDTLFIEAEQKRKWVLAFFHDQGLTPFKLLHFYNGAEVNFGLPWIRTSACHGTAFEIAGRGEANEGSMIMAIKLASMLAEFRNDTSSAQP